MILTWSQIAEEIHKNRTPLTSIQKSSIAKLPPLAINEQTDKQALEIAAFLGKKAHLHTPTIAKEKSSAEGPSSDAPKQIVVEKDQVLKKVPSPIYLMPINLSS